MQDSLSREKVLEEKLSQIMDLVHTIKVKKDKYNPSFPWAIYVIFLLHLVCMGVPKSEKKINDI